MQNGTKIEISRPKMSAKYKYCSRELVTFYIDLLVQSHKL